MSEKQIERFFLSLERSLRWEPARCEDITDELRDHVEEHLHEAVGQGLSRPEAIQTALGELGEAGHLASGLRRAVRQSRLRRLLGRSALSAAALAVAVLIASVLWPAAQRNSALQHQAASSRSTQPRPAERLAGPHATVPAIDVVPAPRSDDVPNVAPLELGAETEARSNEVTGGRDEWREVVGGPLGDRDSCPATCAVISSEPPSDSQGC